MPEAPEPPTDPVEGHPALKKENDPDQSSESPPLVVREPPEDRREPALSFPVVGIGCSSGSLEACIELLQALPTDTGMTFIVAPHLPLDSDSHLPTVFSQITAMPVVELNEPLTPRPDTVYVASPGKRLNLSNGALTPEPAGGRPVMAVDSFLRSLAADQKNLALGVLLSGTDADGALGLKAIKGEGGVAIVQDPDTTQFATLPRSGVLADHVDLILRPAEIARELSRVGQELTRSQLPKPGPDLVGLGDEPQFARILAMLRTVSGIDFRLYKPATLRRRTARRMMLRRVETLGQYATYLQTNPDELRSLQEDILINVTRFFRDPELFAALKADLFRQIFENRPGEQQVRIWVAGCSTGEEVYSIAMCLIEFLSGHALEPPIQIFGTDASDRSIETARAGIYPETIAADVSPERLRRFFVKVDAGYQVSKRVRDLCIFARQNLCNDPPFSRLDLISCRNVLIYFGAEIQQRIVTTFHYALRQKGFLLLGKAETIRDHADIFSPVDRKNKVYIRGDQAGRILPDPIPRLSPSEVYARDVRAAAGNPLNDPDLQRAADRVLLARYTPPGVIVNDRMEVLQVRGRIAPYLEVASGSPSLHLLRMARPGLGPALRAGISRAIAEDVPIVLNDLSIRDDREEVHRFKVDILPIQGVPARGRAFLVVFVPELTEQDTRETPAADTQVQGPEDLTREITRLQHDLSSTRLYLQSLIEDRDNRNQELTSAYEELQSANEELQSTNEELETAKEELQSANEELQTVNEELRNRNTALMHASNDLLNLLNSVNIPVVMLGSDLTIRQYTPPAERLMRIRRADIGRSITEIRLNINIDELELLLHNVLDTLATREVDVQDRDDRWHLLRIRPYRTADNKIDGLVMVLLEVDQIRRGEQAMREARDFAQTIVNTVPVPFVVLDQEFRIHSANGAFNNLSGLAPPELERRSFPELASLLWNIQNVREKLQAAWDGSDPALTQMEQAGSGPGDRILRLSVQAVGTGPERWLLVVVEDLTAMRLAERMLMSERDQLSGEVHTTVEALARTRHELRALAGRLFTTQEDERRRVARELHDDISQKLAALELDTEHLRQTVSQDQNATRHGLEALRSRMTELAHDVRSLSHRLHPTVLDDLGLAAALKSLTEEFGTREKLLTTYSRRNVPATIPRDVGAAFYRIAQEALRNVAKHAGKAHVKVSLEGIEGALRLTIRDSGEGFDMTAPPEKPGLGLISMQERARLVEGTMTIRSELGEGTTITVTAPLPPTTEDGKE